MDGLLTCERHGATKLLTSLTWHSQTSPLAAAPPRLASNRDHPPNVNGNAGRDHWPDCYTVLLASGGITGGSTFASSDRIAAYPAPDPVTPADLAAIIDWRFGLNPQTEIHDQAGRPYRIADGRPIADIFT